MIGLFLTTTTLLGAALSGAPRPEVALLPSIERSGACPSARPSVGLLRLDDDVDRLIKEFRGAEGVSRDKIFDQLSELVYAEELTIILTERANQAASVLEKGNVLDKLGKVAELRKELDAARKDALDLIFDTGRYFTPYRVPEVSSERAAEYRETQAEIDDLTDVVTDLWEDSRKVKLKASFRAAVDDYKWALAKRGTIAQGAAESAVEGLPSWVFGLSKEDPVVTVQSFAWNAAERKSLDLAVLIMRTNAQRGVFVQKQKRGVVEARKPSKSEIDQVVATNDYRLKMGRAPLSWSPLLQEAAQGHSDYQARWGILTHFEDKEPTRRTPGQRCRLAGYNASRAENCAMGTAGPKDVHERWRHSAGHHRNLLLKNTTEMASAIAGSYWTQNFGAGPVTTASLSAWRDDPSGPTRAK